MTKQELINRFVTFINTLHVADWCGKWRREQGKWLPSPEEIFEAGKSYIQESVEKEIQFFLEEYDVEKSIVLDYNCALYVDTQDAWKPFSAGAGIGVGIAAMLGWAVLPVAVIGATFGSLIFREQKINEVKEKLVEISKEYAERCAKEIYDIMQFKQLSEMLSLAPPEVESTEAESTEAELTAPIEKLTSEQAAIKEFLESRGIKYLLHFTSAENLDSIKEHGILSVQELKKRGIPYLHNDSNRLDNELDYISLSVTTINRPLLSSYFHTGRIQDVRVIYISASILYEELETARIYCDRNAAASSCRKGSELSDFYNMFGNEMNYTTTLGVREYDRKKDRRADNEPTDPQAEILFKGCVPTKYIIGIREQARHGY